MEGSNKMYLLFSGVGFTPELKKAVGNGGDASLLTLDDIYEV